MVWNELSCYECCKIIEYPSWGINQNKTI
jgi:hypothetical protein